MAPAGRHRAVVESIGSWYWLSDLLSQCGVELKLAHAADLKAISHAKVKTDRVDAAMLAQLLRVDMIPDAYQIEPERRAERDLLRARLRLVQRKTSCRNSIEGILEKYNARAIEAVPQLYRQQARYHHEQATLLEGHIREIEATLRCRLRDDMNFYRLACLPGFGEIVAATVLLEVGDIGRFPTDRQFFSYARLVPGAQNSAGRRRHYSGHKAGNKYLKLAFGHAALRSIQHYPVIRAAYQKKRRKKPPKVARAWLAKERARIAYHMLKDQKDFDGRFKGEALNRQKTPPWPRPPGPDSKLGKAQDGSC